MKKRILSLVLALILVLSATAAPALAVSTGNLTKQRETEHFEFYCTDQDVKALDDLEASFEGCYDRVTTDLGKTPSGKTRVNIYPDIQSYHNAIGRPNAPDWSVGMVNQRGIVYMVSPLKPGSVHDYDAIITVAVHEYVHAVIRLFGRNQPSYLNEGVACYLAGQPATKEAIQNDLERDILPSLTMLESLDPSDVGHYNVYDYGYLYVDFIVKNFGFDKVVSLLEGKNRSAVLGMSEDELNEAWLAFLKKEYGETPNLNTADEWARSEITSAVKKGFVPTDLQNNYKDTITREQFCRMAIMYLEYATGKDIDTILSEKNLTIDPNAFEDTDNQYILAAYALGITKGTKAPAEGNPGVFTPNGSFSREMAATMLARVSEVLGTNTGNAPDAGYTDISGASGWAVNGINFCYASGVMKGTSESPLKFSPKDSYTIQQSIATFDRMN